MNKESFKEVVRQQYSEEIQAAYHEHLSGGGVHVDVQGLGDKLQTLMNHAQVEGLPAQEFEELARATLPKEITHEIVLDAEMEARRHRTRASKK